MKYAHTNIIAKDWQALSRFYQDVFGCKPTGPKRDLSGDWIEGMTGIKGVHIVGEHLLLPGYSESAQHPTLEIFTYLTGSGENAKEINTPGFAHIAFQVEDVRQVVESAVRHGGSLLCDIVSKQYETLGTGTFAYIRDLEGNLVEIQSWSKPEGQ